MLAYLCFLPLLSLTVGLVAGSAGLLVGMLGLGDWRVDARWVFVWFPCANALAGLAILLVFGGLIHKLFGVRVG
jgi:hypothetical protein